MHIVPNFYVLFEFRDYHQKTVYSIPTHVLLNIHVYTFDFFLPTPIDNECLVRSPDIMVGVQDHVFVYVDVVSRISQAKIS